MCRRVYVLVFAILLIAVPASAASVSGLVTDATGAALPLTRIVLRDIAAGTELVTETGADGRYRIDVAAAGTYLIVVTRPGFAESARTVTIADADQAIDVPVRLSIGAITADVSVTATRGEREIREIPLHVETRSGEAVAQTNPLSTGDALAGAVNITPVGNGPFGVRPRLRGLDSTRLLVLVDGERLNTARQATDRTGAEVGLDFPGHDQPAGDRQRCRHGDVRVRRTCRDDQYHHQRAVILAVAPVRLWIEQFLQHE